MRLCYVLTLFVVCTEGVLVFSESDRTFFKRDDSEGIYNSNNDVDELNETKTLLREIHHYTKRKAIIDISLNKEAFEENCYLQRDNIILTDTDIIEGVTFHSKSHFVSCRVTVGPMTEDLLGLWELCGRSVTTNEVRCRPVDIKWYSKDGTGSWEHITDDSYTHPVHFGGSVNSGVSGNGIVSTCHVITPTGEDLVITSDASYPHIEISSINKSDSCSVLIKDITNESLGNWVVYGIFRSILGQSEVHLPLTFDLYDEDNPYEQAFNITVLKSQTRLVNLGTNFKIDLNQTRGTVEDCFFKSPSGRKFDLKTDEAELPDGVTVYRSDTDALCRISFNPITDDTLGEWHIIGKFQNGVLFDEKHLIYNLIHEEHFVIQNDIHIKEGEDLYLHLSAPISMYHNCSLNGPYGAAYINFELDPVYSSSCGYIIRSVNTSHNGQWIIQYGDKIKYIGHVNVYVLDSNYLSLDDLQWNVGDSIDITLGPKNATYCIVRSTFGLVYDNFGQCQIVLDRVTTDHRGYWTVSVGLPGSVRLQDDGFYVNVLTSDSKPLVTTAVMPNNHSVMLTCSLPVEYEVQACKFRDPRDNILIAAQRLGYDSYVSNMTFTNYESIASKHSCTLRITNPSSLDLGIWRCVLATTAGTYYGFLTVVIPYLMEDPAIVASVVTEPALKASSSSNLEGEPVILSCSIPSPLRYCYFRARNGTIYNVFPRMLPEENFEYVGAGLDSGECGIRFTKFSAKESKGWTCHVGVNTTTREISTKVYADVRVKMVVRHYWSHSKALVVEARVYDEHTLDYCRFVRIDGIGFASDNLPKGYELQGSLHRGFCILYVKNPCVNDLFPWTVAAKLTGADKELSITTTDDLFSLLDKPSFAAEVLFWLFMISMFMIPAMAAFVLIPKQRRDWTFRRASQIRDSFKSSWEKSFGKKPMTPQSA